MKDKKNPFYLTPKVLKGFFSKEQMKAAKAFTDEDKLCEKCGLYKKCITPKMKYTGEGRKKCLILAEAPGKTEDERGKQLIGTVGQLFRNKLKALGFDLDRDFWKINAVNCRPTTANGVNRPPTRKEIKCCKLYVDSIITELKPEYIWLVGGSAVESFYMGRFSNLTISRWRHLCIPDPTVNSWIIPIFHPSYASRNETDDVIQSVYNDDLKYATECLQHPPFTFKSYLDKIILVKEYDKVIELLDRTIKEELEYLVLDYETNRLKPYNNGLIAAISFCAKDIAYSFPYQYRNHFTSIQLEEIKKRWKKLLQNKKIKKVAQNTKFEDAWTRHIFNVYIDWHWCTMNCQHILDAREKFCGLKFQSYIRWGIPDYEKDVKPFLSISDSAGFNKVMEIDLDTLLKYNAIDSLLERWLLEEQKEELTGSSIRAFQFWMRGLQALGDIQQNGIPIKKNYYEEQDKEVGLQIEQIEKEIKISKELALFEKIKKRPINLNSDKDMRELFFDMLKLPSLKTTASGLSSIDEETLISLDNPLAQNLIRRSKLDKIKNTYIAQFKRETYQDSIHPFFDIHTVRTFRSSSALPNWQNIPVRDEDAKRITRSGVIPSPGNIILDWDYGSGEVRIAACYTEDPILIDYINNPKTDMHRDSSCDLFCLDDIIKTMPSKNLKKIRFFAKNEFVFPEFYLSYYKSCARSMWKDVMKLEVETGQTVLEHLQSVGVIRKKSNMYEQWENHVKEVEKEFWEKFKVFRKWQKSWVKKYVKKGYLEMFHGHRISGYLSPSQIVNTPIQGTLFHCLLESLVGMNEQSWEEEWKTKIIGQIHDCCLFDCDPEEELYVVETSEYFATDKIRKDNPWIIVPLVIEWERTGVDKSWYTKEEVIYESKIPDAKKGLLWMNTDTNKLFKGHPHTGAWIETNVKK